MNIKILENSKELGEAAAKHAADVINKNIKEKGYARILVATGGSQFDFFQALTKKKIDWKKVTAFNLDEYIGIDSNHKASFRKYLKERLIEKTGIEEYYFVDGEGDIKQNIDLLTEKVNEEPIDLGVIGIGENAHIAFNDPPADFETKESFIVVKLDLKCKEQQVGEGWFPGVDDVPSKAITMTPHKIMECKEIISCVPHSAKAQAVKDTLDSEMDPNVPAGILKKHPRWTLYLDRNSSSLIDIQERDM